ncbi:hypothetical protein SAMN04244559_01092 [Magnetospirillum fulvum]|uniref:Uncharacterized protein n=1 Tax=Magnetospirillum fulvum TaxID=1082 RepID=A0A1H6HAP0_MAGFU|nr:hypothetical protein SAMN04244559_01092 [Magnetospirillum fulvum]
MASVAQCHADFYFFIWHSMTQQIAHSLSAHDVTQVFGISKRTLERKISSGALAESQIYLEGGKRFFYMSELIRVF